MLYKTLSSHSWASVALFTKKSFEDKHFHTLYNMLSATTLRASAPAILATKHRFLTSGTRVACCGLLHGVQTRKFTGSANSFFLATTPKTNQERHLKEFRERSFPHPVYTEAQMDDIVSSHVPPLAERRLI